MKNIIKNIITDFHSRPLPEYKERNLKIPVNSGKIITIIGSRRCGKTYLLYQIIDSLLRSVKKQDIIYINFEDERLNLSATDLQLIIDSYYELYPDNNRPLYFFFDEIQNVAKWELFVRRIYDTISKNIFITGSSSKLLSREIATGLRGRAISYELYPLIFDEFIRFKGVNINEFYSTRNKAKLKLLFLDFMFQGGFPEVVNYDEDLRIRTIQSYLDVMIYRDLIERYNIKNHNVLKYLIKKSISNISNRISVNKLINELKSVGFKIAKDNIYQLIDYAQDSYLLFFVNIFSHSFNVRKMNDKKIYCIDNGMANYVTGKFSEDKGRLLENLVFLFLKASEYELYYYNKKRECDFLVFKNNKLVSAIQVCYELNEFNRLREIEGLLEAMDEVNSKKGIILTFNDEESLTFGKKEIRIYPLWKWLLKPEF